MAEVVKTRFKQLSKASTEWTSLNPTLLEGEIGFESDTNKLKVGNGVDAWNNLEYVAGSDSSDVDISNLVDLSNKQTITNTKTFTTSEGSWDTGYFPITIAQDYKPGINFESSYHDDLYIGNNFWAPNAHGIAIGYDISLNGTVSNDKNICIGFNVSSDASNADADLNYTGSSVVIGDNSSCTRSSSIVVGYDAHASKHDAIQLGTGTNNTSNTFQVWNYALLDGNTGLIPNERLNLGTKKYLHRITLNLSDQVSGTAPTKMAVIHLDYYSEQETAYTSPNFATLALTNSIGCSGYYIDADVSLTEKNFVYEIALPQSNEFILNNNVSITIQSTGSSITDEVIGYIFS